VDAHAPLVGAQGPVPLVDVFEGRQQLITYLHMWHDDKPAAEQCEGCTFFTGHVRELSYLHSRGTEAVATTSPTRCAHFRYRSPGDRSGILIGSGGRCPVPVRQSALRRQVVTA